MCVSVCAQEGFTIPDAEDQEELEVSSDELEELCDVSEVNKFGVFSEGRVC